MKSKKKSGYIGSVDRWTSFFRSLVGLKKYGRLSEFFDSDAIEKLESMVCGILDLAESNRIYYLKQIDEYPFNLPPSFKDLWISGGVDIFEVLFSYLNGYRDVAFIPSKTVMYGREFYSPKSVFKYRDVNRKPSGNYLKSFKSILEERMASYEEKPPVDYFTYPHDEYRNPPAQSFRELVDGYLIANGEMEVNGSFVLMYADDRFADDECEVAIISVSECSVMRYRSIAELLMLHLAHLLWGGEAHSQEDLLRIDEKFKLIFS